MPGAGSIYHHATGTFVATIVDGDAAGLAAAKLACAAGGLIQMGPGTEGITLGSGWQDGDPTFDPGICLVRIDSLGGLFISNFHIADYADLTKIVHLDCSSVGTGVQRFVNFPDWSGILPLPSTQGTSGQFLKSLGFGVQPIWDTPTPGGINALLDATNHTDTVAQAVTRGSLIYGNSTPKWDELVIGAANTVLTSNGTDVAWSANPAIAHEVLSHLKPVAIASCLWNNGSTTISSANLPGAVKVGDYVLLGDQSRAGCQGRIVTVLGAGQVTVDATNAAPGGVNISGTFWFQPGDHFNDALTLESGGGTGMGLFLTGGRGTYNATDTSGTFQEIRGPVNWRGHGFSIGSMVPSDFRAAISGSTGTLSGFCLEGGTAGGGRVYWFHNVAGDRIISIPNFGANDTMVFTGLAQTLLSKTLTSAVFSAGTAGAGSHPKLTPGTLLTTPEVGALELDTNCLYGTTDAGNRGVIPIRHFIRCNAVRNLPNDTNLNAIFDSPANGRLTLETGTYLFDMVVGVTAMSATNGNALLDVLGAGTATVNDWLYIVGGRDGPLGTAAAFGGGGNVTAATPASMVSSGTSTEMSWMAKGTFTVTVAGTLIPSIDQVTASAAVVSIGSYFSCERIGDTGVVSVGQWD